MVACQGYHAEGSLGTGARGWEHVEECGGGSIGIRVLGWDHGDGRVGTGAFGYQHGNGSIITCRGGLEQFFLPIILKFSSSFIFFFLSRSLKKFTEEEKVNIIWFCVRPFFLPRTCFSIILNFFSPFIFFLPASLKKFTEKE